MASEAALANITEEQQSAAREKLLLWLRAWQSQCWGTMASHSQLPQSLGKGELEISMQLEKRLGPNYLQTFGIREFIGGHSEAVGGELCAFADFDVVALVRENVVGLRLRLVFDGKKWGVNYTSMNRRFDPGRKG